MKNSLFIIILLFSVTSCLKEELPVAKKNMQKEAGLRTVAIELGMNYKQQIFFNLSKNEIRAENEKKIWDIGFETGKNGWHVITNTSKYMFVYRTNKTELTTVSVSDKNSIPKYYDSPTGSLDFTGMGNWKDKFVRILDMGTDANGNDLGCYKIKIIAEENNYYHFKYAKIGSNNILEDSIPKNKDYNFVYYSLKSQKQVLIAPKTQDWDLVFTQFIQHLYDPFEMDYLVTGCLSNRYNTKVALVTEVKFKDIDLSYANSLGLSDEINTIGYDWKDVGLDEVMAGGSPDYKIYPNKSYVIKDQNGAFYKLRFISFYSKTGVKGTPTFEYKRLD